MYLTILDTGAAIVLGVVQGLTEFLPVSSSGHLVLGQELWPGEGLGSPGVLFEVVVHLGTLAAALVFLRREVAWLLVALIPGGGPERTGGRRLAALLILASLPAAALGIGLRDVLLTAFEGVGAASVGLVLTGTVLLASRRLRDSDPPEPGPAAGLPGGLGAADALFVGTAQAAAILPGVSRSGFTILAGRLRGLPPAAAARFSFLLSAPVIAGAAALEGASTLAAGGGAGIAAELAAGFMAALVSGLLALRWVFSWLERRRFHRFGWYCLLAGGVGLGWSAS